MRFNEKKATQATAYFLKLRGGVMSYLKLIKLLYLADRESLLRWGRTITTDNFVAMDHGMVVSRIKNLMVEEKSLGTAPFWTKYISDAHDYEISLKDGDPGNDELSPVEIGLLEDVFEQHGRKSRWELRDLTHELPEWIDPKGSSITVQITDILRLSGKTERETKIIQDQLDASDYSDFVFSK